MLHDEAVQGSKSSRGAAAPPLDMASRRLPARSTLVRATGERMRRRLRLGDHLVDLRLPLEGALDRFLHRPIVEVEDLLVVLRLPVDEHAHQDAVVVHFVSRDDARGHAVDHRATKRSEEHTSELQSPCNLVCRLLLEKKKKNTTST